ncbi:MAG: BTAD domain-containing putative transcriptional regulator [Erysipelotrichaceae bacterium]
MELDKDIMKIQMFKEFVIEYHNERIIINDFATRQMTNLLAILIYYRRKPINKEQLIELMWQDNDNPLNVMKFSIFRLRALLKEIPVLSELDLVVTSKAGYEFNPNIKVEIDIELVEDNWHLMNTDSETNVGNVKRAKTILDIYKGQFLEGNNEEWIIHCQSYYQNMYMNAFEIYCSYLYREKKYEPLIEIAAKGIALDKFDEEAYYYYLRGLIEDQQYHKALSEFKDVQKLFLQEYGTPLSLKLRNLYGVIVAKDEEDQIDIVTLKEKLTNELDEDGAFYCEYELFRHIYQVELRNAKREAKPTFLIVFEICYEGSEKDQLQAMEKLKNVIQKTLRKGDVFSRINKVQFVLLIPCKDIENAHMVIHRITSTYYRKVSKNKIKLHYHLSSLLDYTENDEI